MATNVSLINALQGTVISGKQKLHLVRLGNNQNGTAPIHSKVVETIMNAWNNGMRRCILYTDTVEEKTAYITYFRGIIGVANVNSIEDVHRSFLGHPWGTYLQPNQPAPPDNKSNPSRLIFVILKADEGKERMYRNQLYTRQLGVFQ